MDIPTLSGMSNSPDVAPGWSHARMTELSESGMLGQADSSRGPQYPIYFVAFSVDGKIIVSVPEQSDGVWDTDTRCTIAAVPMVFTPNSNTAAVSPNGKWIAISKGGFHHRFMVTGVTTIDAHTHRVHSIAFSPDSKRILTASSDKTIRINTLNL